MTGPNTSIVMSPTTQLLLLAQLRDPLDHSDALPLALRHPGAAGKEHPQNITVWLYFQERYLPAMAAGESVASLAITEPGAGSDMQGVGGLLVSSSLSGR